MLTLCLRLKIVKFYGEYQSCREFYEDVSSVLICCFCCMKITSRLYYCSQDNVADRSSPPVYIQIILLHENWKVGKIDQILIWRLTSWVILFLQSSQNRDMLCARLLFCSKKNAFLFSMICWKHNQFFSTSCLQIANEVQFRMGTIRFICTCYAMSFYFITVHEGLAIFVQILDSVQVHVAL